MLLKKGQQRGYKEERNREILSIEDETEMKISTV